MSKVASANGDTNVHTISTCEVGDKTPKGRHRGQADMTAERAYEDHTYTHESVTQCTCNLEVTRAGHTLAIMTSSSDAGFIVPPPTLVQLHLNGRRHQVN